MSAWETKRGREALSVLRIKCWCERDDEMTTPHWRTMVRDEARRWLERRKWLVHKDPKDVGYLVERYNSAQHCWLVFGYGRTYDVALVGAILMVKEAKR